MHRSTTEGKKLMDFNYSESLNVTVTLDNRTVGDRKQFNGTLEIYEFHQVAQISFLAVLFCLITVGNLLVLATVIQERRNGKRLRMNFFVLHLALADLSMAAFYVLPDLIHRVTVIWHGTDGLCKLYKFMQVLSAYGSTYIIVSMSIDRLDAILCPMKFITKGRRAIILVVTAWVMAAILATPTLILFQEMELADGQMQCISTMFIDVYKAQVYMVLNATAMLFIPAILITCCYVLIGYKLWKKSGGTTGNSFAFTDRSSKKSDTEDNLQQKSFLRHRECQQSSSGLVPHARMRAIKMTFVIVIAFLVCWSPYFIFNLMFVYGVYLEQNHMAVVNFIQSCAPLNGLLNPIIYGIFNTTACAQLKNRLRKACPRQWQMQLMRNYSTRSTYDTALATDTPSITV